MKTIILQGDAVASVQLPELGERTPLQVASTPNLDFLASHGEFGFLTLSAKGYDMQGDITHLALLGYDPSKYYSGPAQFEGASLEVVLEKQDLAFLCDLVTLRSTDARGDVKKLGPHLIMDDDQVREIDSEEAREMIDAVNDQLASETIQFYAGKGHRHLMVWAGGTGRRGCGNPRAAVGKSIEPYLPVGEGSEVLRELMEASRIILRNHPVNREREEAGLKPANCLWLWGAGKSIELPKLTERYSISGATVSIADLHLGIGIHSGLEPVNPADHSEFASSDFYAYAKICFQALRSKDLVYLHVQACPDAIGAVDSKELISTIEAFDEQLVGTLLKTLPEFGAYRLVVACNHALIEARDQKPLPTPFVVYGNKEVKENTPKFSFNEIGSGHGSARDATRVLDRLLANA